MEQKQPQYTVFLPALPDGQQAYFIISTHYEHPHALLFAKLSERFMDLQRILQALRPVAPNGDRH